MNYMQRTSFFPSYNKCFNITCKVYFRLILLLVRFFPFLLHLMHFFQIVLSPAFDVVWRKELLLFTCFVRHSLLYMSNDKISSLYTSCKLNCNSMYNFGYMMQILCLLTACYVCICKLTIRLHLLDYLVELFLFYIVIFYYFGNKTEQKGKGQTKK